MVVVLQSAFTTTIPSYSRPSLPRNREGQSGQKPPPETIQVKNAVEASVSRAKALGATSNLYIVEDETKAFATGSKDDGKSRAFAISTRSFDHPTRIGYLFETEHNIDTLWPRPNVSDGWNKEDTTGLWHKTE